MNDTISVLIVDDNPLMCLGLSETISVEPVLKVIGEAANGEEALAFLESNRPDVITMDYQMPGDNGIEVTRKIMAVYPEAKIILLSVYDSEEDIWNAVQAGAKGYLTKKAGSGRALLDAIQTVAGGKDYFPEELERKLNLRRGKPNLTRREHEMLELLAAGRSNKEMADILNISVATVKIHIMNLRGKLGAVDRTQAVVIAYKRGILHLDE